MKSDFQGLKLIFEKMKKDDFDVMKPLKWGFYFFDNDKKKLLKIFKELEGNDYVLENIQQMDDLKWRLFVTKIDILTPEKLHKRNLAFNELAEYFSVSLYDGWDVERV